jgi:VanZ family protein
MSAPRLRRIGQGLAAFSAAVIAYATLAPGVPAPDVDTTFLHFLLFIPLGLGGSLWMAELDADQQGRARLFVLGLVLLFAAGTELGQALVGRNPSFNDFMADAAGGGLGVLVGSWLVRRARRDS